MELSVNSLTEWLAGVPDHKHASAVTEPALNVVIDGVLRFHITS